MTDPKIVNVSANSQDDSIKAQCGPYAPCFPLKGCPPNPCPPNTCCPNFGVGMTKEKKKKIDINLLKAL